MARAAKHITLSGSKRAKNTDAKIIGKVDPKETFSVTIGLSGPKLPGADEFVGQTLSREEFAEQYGAKQADADKVANSLKKYGLEVESVSLPTRSMVVKGTTAQMEAAFKPGLVMMRTVDQGEYRGRQGALQIPSELKGIVTGVFGLDERRMARRKARTATARAVSHALAPLTPADLEQRYNFPPGDAAGQQIAIAEFGGGYFASDTAAYCNKFGRPVPNVQTVPVEANAPVLTLQDILALPKDQRDEELGISIEVMMDVQVIAGLCPAADISVYFSTFDQGGWVDLLNAVITARPAVLSISWGLAEDDSSWSSNAINAINDRLNAARLLGITICVSAGDDGSGDQLDDGKAHVDFPASSPFVLAVGGTMLESSAGSEVTWWEAPGRRTNNGGGSTGGGVSVEFDRPAWQTVRVRSLNSGAIDGRIIPDVAALAGQPLYDLVFVGQPQPNGGTSASAPLWAALIARVYARLAPAKRQRFLTPLLYQAGSAGTQPVGAVAFRDITDGDNKSTPPGKGYKATKGFDAVTGWGVPDGIKLLNAL